MKRIIALFLVLIVTSLHADYSSLTTVEKARVKKAFMMASYYKYYATLADAKDKIKLIRVEVLKERSKDVTYYLTLDLVVSNKTFRRYQTITMNKWKRPYTPAILAGSGGIVVGLVLGLLLTR